MVNFTQEAGKPPVIGEGSDKTNFVAAARRAAQAAAAAAPEKAPRTEIEGLENGKMTTYRTENYFESKDSIRFEEWSSTDGTTWTKTNEGHETRVK